jgi:ankyrin repeat protein
VVDESRCDEQRRLAAIDAAFRSGDLGALRAAVEDPSVVPNGPMPMAIGPCLVYAVYHSPLRLIRELLEHGANPDADDGDGFPPLIAAISCLRPQPGAPGRVDVVEIVHLLLDFHADPNVRGINDWTPLHMAVMQDGLELARVLLARGADPTLRTRIDDGETARELAAARGARDLQALLAAAEATR